MAQPFIEHVNITVSDVDRAARMLDQLFGWKVRWNGEGRDNGHTVHVGSDTHYIALYSDSWGPAAARAHRKGAPLNHIGVQVPDLDAVEKRVIDLGLEPFSHADYEPGRRFYFFDWDGIEYEVVSYA
ncbi:MAG: VOC family protein [Hyphomonadaceae bacterium]